jgi:hypothetical protein
MLASGVGLVAATAALWVQGWRRADHRFFAGLISIAVTLSLFSVVAWAATAFAPLPLTWVVVGTLALLFALRLYRELQEPSPSERSHVVCLAEITPPASEARDVVTGPAVIVADQTPVAAQSPGCCRLCSVGRNQITVPYCGDPWVRGFEAGVRAS